MWESPSVLIGSTDKAHSGERAPMATTKGGRLPDPQVVTGVGSRFDVGDVVVQPSYRSTPWEAEAREESSNRTYVRLNPNC